MVNYACAFSQWESRKYFEIIKFAIILSILAFARYQNPIQFVGTQYSFKDFASTSRQ